MTELYLGGERVGTLESDPNILAALIRSGQRVEPRDEAGNRLGQVIPCNEPLVP